MTKNRLHLIHFVLFSHYRSKENYILENSHIAMSWPENQRILFFYIS